MSETSLGELMSIRSRRLAVLDAVRARAKAAQRSVTEQEESLKRLDREIAKGVGDLRPPGFRTSTQVILVPGQGAMLVGAEVVREERASGWKDAWVLKSIEPVEVQS